MKIITISREFGSGGRELGKRLADYLGFLYYDKEILETIAQSKGVSADYVEHILQQDARQGIPLTFHRSFSVPSGLLELQTNLLSEQTKVLEAIAAAGKDCIIVGRNADQILKKQQPFNIFVCAEKESKIQRCLERANPDETLTPKEIEKNMRRIDKNRAYCRESVHDSIWGDPKSYHITVNTTGWNIKDLVPSVAGFAAAYFEKHSL